MRATTPPARSESVREDTIGVWRATALDRRAGGEHVARGDGHPESARTASISTLAPLGSAATPIATRAGGSVSKNVP